MQLLVNAVVDGNARGGIFRAPAQQDLHGYYQPSSGDFALFGELYTATDSLSIDLAGKATSRPPMRHEDPDRPEVREVLELLDAQWAQAEARGEARGKARGEARGQAMSVLVLLDARGISPTEAERACIETPTDASALRTWLVRAANARSSRELFE